MSYATERAVIEKRWKALWVADGSSRPRTPYQLENLAFEKPAKGPWTRLTVQHGEAFQASCGQVSRWFRHPGIVFIQLFAPLAEGTKELRELGDLATSIFRTVREGTMLFETPTFQLLEPEATWARAIVRAPFYRDELF